MKFPTTSRGWNDDFRKFNGKFVVEDGRPAEKEAPTVRKTLRQGKNRTSELSGSGTASKKRKRMEKLLKCSADVEACCLEWGFLPFFRCGIPGFSIEELIAREYWFTDEEGAWEWKGPIIREGHCAYGKFFNRKAGFVSREWLPEWINYRRSRQLAPNEDAAALDDVVLQTIEVEGSATIQELRRMLGFAKGRGRHRTSPSEEETPEDEKISLDPILTRLQMEGRLVIADFEYNLDRHGNPYGWGVARYMTPEALYGSLKIGRSPEESHTRILERFRELFPDVAEIRLSRLIG